MGPDFEPPLILDAASRSRASRIRDAMLTALLWVLWLYLLLAAVGTLWVPPFVQHLLPVSPPEHPWVVIRLALLNLLVALAVCALMFVRVLLERRRFAGDDRRLGFAPPSEAEIAAALSLPAADLTHWRAAKRLVVHHDATGRVVEVETAA